MTTQSMMERLFGDDSFFQDDFPLWGRRGSFLQHFLQRRDDVLERFNLDGAMSDLLRDLEDFSSSSSSSYSSSSSSRIIQIKPERSGADPGADPGAQELPDLKDPPALTNTQRDTLLRLQSLEDIFIPPSSPSSSSETIFSLDVPGASPDDITVTLTGRTLEIKAPEPGSGASVREVDLPDHVHPSTLTCTLGVEGLLRVETDRPETSQGKQLIPIRFRTALDFSMKRDE